MSSNFEILDLGYPACQGYSLTLNDYIEIKVTDMGTMKAFGAFAAAALPGVEIDRETEDGYEKTTKILGYSAMEKFSKSKKKAEVRLFVEGRFVVEIDGKGVEMKTVKAAVEAIDIKKLASMKDQGVKAK